MSSETEPVIPDHIRAAIHAGHVGRIVIFCDRCNLQDEADYTGETKEVRLAAARKHLAEKGWRCDVNGDLCPACATAPAEREQEAPAPEISDERPNLNDLRDIIAECLYDAANENEDGPGGGLLYWTQFVDGWVMQPVAEHVWAALASCEAEVRRRVAREIDKEAEKCLTARDRLPLSNPRGETHERQAAAYRHAARIARGES